MKMKVTIVDDTGRRTRCSLVSMIDYIKSGGKLPPGRRLSYILVPVGYIDGPYKNRKIMDTVEVKRVFEGRHLELCVLRAKRWMRSKRFREQGGAPRHIALAMAAFSKADRKGFNEALHNAVA
ncbi:MAG: hypothetical protein V3S55_15265 [Nitrospiraceae bacterium]